MARSFAEQHAINRAAWEWRVLASPPTNLTVKAETDRNGRRIMTPPREKPRPQNVSNIPKLLGRLLPTGFWEIEAPVSTLEGVQVPYVVWYCEERAAAWEADPDEILSTVAPGLCVEVDFLPPISVRALRRRMEAYFAVGVREVWVCKRQGKMSFYGPRGVLDHSAICPAFPDRVPARLPL